MKQKNSIDFINHHLDNKPADISYDVHVVRLNAIQLKNIWVLC